MPAGILNEIIAEFFDAGTVITATLESLSLARKPKIMKLIPHQLAAAAFTLFALATTIPEAQSAAIKLEGSGYYRLSKFEVFSGNGKEQSGRYRNLGRDYYHNIEYGVDYISNQSTYRSGSLSYEFWALPFYGATSGIVLMTRGLSPLSADRSYVDLYRYGYGISLDEYRYPEQNIWEYTSKGWRFRDSLAFSRKTLL